MDLTQFQLKDSHSSGHSRAAKVFSVAGQCNERQFVSQSSFNLNSAPGLMTT